MGKPKVDPVRIAEAQRLVDEAAAKKKVARAAQKKRDEEYREQLAKSTPYSPGSRKRGGVKMNMFGH